LFRFFLRLFAELLGRASEIPTIIRISSGPIAPEIAARARPVMLVETAILARERLCSRREDALLARSSGVVDR
jgi:hypothetical protein